LLTKNDPIEKQAWPGLKRAKSADDDRSDPAWDSRGGKQRLYTPSAWMKSLALSFALRQILFFV
jgi:hypothetical protein